MLACCVCVAADTFDALGKNMSVARHGDVVVATAASPERAARLAHRISAYDREIRRRHFPSLEHRPVHFVVGDDISQLTRLTPDAISNPVASTSGPFGYYLREQRIVVASTARGDGAVLRELMRAHVDSDNPNAPRWFETAMASLYESSVGEGAALTPVLDERLVEIAADQDLDYDVFAGICDCYPLTQEQRALVRLLVVYLYGRDELGTLYEVVARKGPYITLLESLDAMRFDRRAWKAYAQRRLGSSRNTGEKSH